MLHDFATVPRRQSLVDPQVDRIADELDRTVSQGKLGPSDMHAAEVFEVPDRIVGNVVGNTHDACFGNIGFVDEAVLNDAA